MNKCIVVVFLLFSIHLQANWEKKEATCPICLQKNDFLKVKVFSNEIYLRPSRFQYVFWPFTDSRSFYCCKRCSFTTMSWHFQELPLNRLEPVGQNLYTSVATAFKKYNFGDGNYPTYDKVPMAMKLHIAENVYKSWLVNEEDYKKLRIVEDEFWCEFYRTKGYHLEREAETLNAKIKLLEQKLPQVLEERKHPGKAKSILSALLYPVLKFMISNQTEDFIQHYRHKEMKQDHKMLLQKTEEARRLSLERAKKVLNNKDNRFPQKEYLYIAGAMSYLVKEKKQAKNYFEKALKIDYTSNQMDEEQNKQYGAYLNKLIQEYLRKL